MSGLKRASVTREFIDILSRTRVLTCYELSMYFAGKMRRWLLLLLLNMVLKRVLRARERCSGGGTRYGSRASRTFLKLLWWLQSAGWGKP